MKTIVTKYSIPLKPSDVQFTGWVKWEERKEKLDFCMNLPGIYIMGIFNKAPAKKVPKLDKSVVYIGETVDQTFSKRWYQFDRSAFQGKNGHSGGWTFREEMTKKEKESLYVAAIPVDLDKGNKDAYIRYVERMLIAHYVKKIGKLPVCNSK